MGDIQLKQTFIINKLEFLKPILIEIPLSPILKFVEGLNYFNCPKKREARTEDITGHCFSQLCKCPRTLGLGLSVFFSWTLLNQAPSQQQMRMWPGSDGGGGGQDPAYTQLLLHKPAASQQHQRHILDPAHHNHPTYSHHGNGERGLRQSGQTGISGGGGQQGSPPQMNDSMDVGMSLGLHHLGAVSSMEASQFGSASLPLTLPIGLSAFRTRTAPSAPGPKPPPPDDYYPASNNNNATAGGRVRPDSEEGPAKS